ncbi:hypothetical protein MNBD_GAMMA06-1549 [hydrothermal vent metagenome]|uniref:Periplasmic thiol:disulfide oxidoreductase DsbB, required for DsbA reoxidation n=1 Tax=hydrothermal vent metagenome TaxID=652676 RepID=A0A3B0WMY3_9ZZZZ
MNSIEYLRKISHNPWYWRSYILGGLALLITALVFQHILDELPCVVCIQIRLLITLLILVAIIGSLSCNASRKVGAISVFSHLSTIAIAAVLTERSYLLLGTERGFIFAACGFDLGLPAWFAIEKWLPWFYRIETSCGYTPELIFGITMAEALMVMSVFLLLISVTVFLAFIVPAKTKR